MSRPKISELRKVPSSLIGRGGLGLAMFHLARLGYEFVPTIGHSAEGDLWVRFGEALESVEVKTTRTGTWSIRAAQLARVSKVIFVDMEDGCCWIAGSAEVRRNAGPTQTIAVTPPQLDRMGATAWHKAIPKVCPNPQVMKAIPGAKGNRVVRNRLADGTVKVYEYPPHRAALTTF
jgi:hypothetical protein